MGERNGSSTRRDALRMISGGIGVSGLANAALPVAGKADRSKRVVIARGGLQDEPIATQKVPKEWLKHENAIESVEEEIFEQYSNDERVVGISLVSSDKSILNYSLSKVSLKLDSAHLSGPAEEVLSSDTVLPSTLDEASVDVPQSVKTTEIEVEVRQGEPTALCAGDYTTDPFRGGLFVSNEDVSPGEDKTDRSYFTSGVKIFHTEEYDTYMYTANHPLAPGQQVGEGDTNCVKGDGEKVYDYQGNLIATGTDKAHVGHDWILAKLDESMSTYITSGILQDGETPEDNRTQISGYLTKEGIGTINSTNEEVIKFGATTGYDSGEILGRNEYYNAGCFGYIFTGVKTDTRTAGGDSGGPIWAEVNGDAAILSVVHGGDSPPGAGYPGCNGATMDKVPKPIGYPMWRVINNNPFALAQGGITP